MITTEILTLPATGYCAERKPVEGFAEFVNAVLQITNTGFEDWSFTGQEGTQAVADGYFWGLYKRNDGFTIYFLLSTGDIVVDCKQNFRTTPSGFKWWFFNSYWESEQGKGMVQDVNPELISSKTELTKFILRKQNGISSKAKSSLNNLIKLSQA